MAGTIPVMRINYSLCQVIKSIFVGGNGKYCGKLKDSLRSYFGCENVSLTSSARCAIYQLVYSLPQKKVVVPAYTCEVVIEAIQLTGKNIIYADIDKKTLNIKEYPTIDADTIVVATHQYGIIDNIEKLAEECAKKGAVLIEDCAGSFGGRLNGCLVGTIGDYGVFSFSASKTVHSPTKGGFIIAKSKEDLMKIKPLPVVANNLRSFKIKQLIKAIGFCLANNKLMSSVLFSFSQRGKNNSFSNPAEDESYYHVFYDWQAYVVLKQMKYLDKRLEERKELFRYYNDKISNPLIHKPLLQDGSVCIRYPILVADRDMFFNLCKREQVLVGAGYHRLYCNEECHIAQDVIKQIVYLPFGNGYSKKDINKVVRLVNSYR